MNTQPQPIVALRRDFGHRLIRQLVVRDIIRHEFACGHTPETQAAETIYAIAAQLWQVSHGPDEWRRLIRQLETSELTVDQWLAVYHVSDSMQIPDIAPTGDQLDLRF